MSNIVFRTTRNRQRLLLWATLIVFVVIALVGCGSADGGQASPNDGSSEVNGRDRQEIEFSGDNMEVQGVTVDGFRCVVAQSSNASAAIWCEDPS